MAMEQYYVPDNEKVNITSMYMSVDVKLWWRTRVEDATAPKVLT